MIAMRATITWEAPPSALKKHVSAAKREVLRELGARWHDRTLPRHFEESAYARYGSVFQKRSSKYNKSKGHRRPMVYSGQMRRDLLGYSMVRSSAKKTTVQMRTPRALNLAGRYNMPDFKAEIQAFNAQEDKEYTSRMERLMTRKLNTLRARKQRRS